MINEELKTFISKMRVAGKTDPEITAELKTAGWEEGAINQGLSSKTRFNLGKMKFWIWLYGMAILLEIVSTIFGKIIHSNSNVVAFVAEFVVKSTLIYTFAIVPITTLLALGFKLLFWILRFVPNFKDLKLKQLDSKWLLVVSTAITGTIMLLRNYSGARIPNGGIGLILNPTAVLGVFLLLISLIFSGILIVFKKQLNEEMLCPKCNFQNQEGRANCQECKQLLPVKHTFSFWKIEFFIELFLLVLFVVLIVVLTSDNMNLKLRVSTVVPQISQPSPTPTIYPQIASWKTYTNPEFGVTFQYPSDWEIDDSYGSLWVKHMSENCEHLDPITCQYYGFYIEPWDLMGEQVNTEDPALYLLENLLREEKRVEECTVRTGTFCQGEIGIPGWPAYVGRNYGPIEIYGDSRQTLFPAIEFSTMPRVSGNLQYLVVGNKRFYLIELAAPDLVSSADLIRASARMDGGTENNHPIIQIVRSLRFL